MRKKYLTLAGIVLTSATIAQPAENTVTRFISHPLLPVYITGAAVLLLLALVLIVAVYALRFLILLTRETKRQSAHEAVIAEPVLGWWKKVFQKMNPFYIG